MTERAIRLTAWTVAVLAQVAFLAAYSRLTDGCFCTVTGRTNTPPAADYVLWVGTVTAHPLVLLVVVGGTRGAALLAAILNAGLWFIGAYLVLKLLVLLFRIRIGSRAGDGRSLPLHLVDPTRVRARWIAALAVVLLMAALLKGASYRRWWMAESERAVHAAITAVARGDETPAGIAVSINAGTYDPPPPTLAGRYRLERDTRREVHPFDMFVPPDGREGWIRFANGPRCKFYVFRETAGWRISIFARAD